MHYLQEVIKKVDATHPHLGNPIALAMLAIKAKKLLVLISPRGCGKSRVTSFVGLSHPEKILCDRLSVAGLAALKEEFTGFNGVVVIDDIAKTQTPYARTTTLTTLAELCYSHYCISHLAGTNYDIRDFYGAALVNIQPVLLREAVQSSEWEASLQDKSIRYYHLYRPIKPNPLPPDVKLEWGFDIKKVETPELKGKVANKLLAVGEVQWGLARLREHITDLLKAAAALDRRTEVISSDFRVLLDLIKPLQIEQMVSGKRELESDRYFLANELAILTEFVSYGNFTLKHLSSDYKLGQSRCYEIMGKYHRDWRIVKKNPTTYAPSDELEDKLRRLGLI